MGKIVNKILMKVLDSKCKKHNVKFTYSFDKEEYLNKQTIIIADHAATDTYMYVMAGYKDIKVCPVTGENNLYSLPTKFLLSNYDVIPKKLFVKDAYALRGMLKAVKNGKTLLFFPEGIQSLCGYNSPTIPTTISFLKKMKIDVILAKSKGTYLANPKYNRNKYNGQIEVDYQILFTKDELENKSIEELTAKYNKEFLYNDFEYNEKANNHYKGKVPVTKNIENIIHYCPKCGSIGYINSENDSIKCMKCNNEILVDDTYRITKKSNDDVLPFNRLDEWFKFQRKLVNEEVRKDDFKEEIKVCLKAFRKYIVRNPYKDISNGILTIDKNSISYKDDKFEEYNFSYDIKDVPSLPLNSRVAMQFYINDKLYLFKYTFFLLIGIFP